MNSNKLASGCEDHSIKVWNVYKRDITLIKEIISHINPVLKVIPLSQGQFGSCSEDKTVKLWKNDQTYDCLIRLKHNERVTSILQLTGKEILVSACGYSSLTVSDISFWDMNDYTLQHTITGYGFDLSTHIIELFDGNIALSSSNY